jgi:superfamily II DNA or RNA helicase/RNA polymerase subunit RPABC4/transcription elongation factor Spt4
MFILEQYQESGVYRVGQKLAAGIRSIVFQLATGGGKTVVFSAICARYTVKAKKSVLILVHRKELLQQTRRTLYNGFGIVAQPIIAGMHHIPHAQVYVGMVESVNRRIDQIRDHVGLVIIDECHIANFNKIHHHFPQAYTVGFTATPLAASRKDPLKNYYQDIVCGVDIPELIKLNKTKPERGLCQNITFLAKDTVDRSELKIKNGEFDEGLMALYFSKPKHVQNTVTAYEKYAPGTKAIIFNCNIDHSLKVTAAFREKGYDCRHVDGETPQGERDEIFRWFKHTPGATLCNVGIATTGFDEPTIETVIVNRSTMSLPLWLQMCGRGGRPTLSKSVFFIIDMGNNAYPAHGDWCDPRDWENIFHNPPKPGDGKGNAPVKDCPQCDAIVAVQVRVCPHCGFEFPRKPEELEKELEEFIVITKGINVKDVIARHKEKKEYYPFFYIGDTLAKDAEKVIPKMTDENAAFILQQYHAKAQEWCDEVGKKYNQWHRERARDHLYTKLRERFPDWSPSSNEQLN